MSKNEMFSIRSLSPNLGYLSQLLCTFFFFFFNIKIKFFLPDCILFSNKSASVV